MSRTAARVTQVDVAGRGTVGKTAVVAMRERKGRMKAMAVEDADMATLHTKIHQHVAAGSTLHTDEAGVYRGLGGLFFNHDKGVIYIIPHGFSAALPSSAT